MINAVLRKQTEKKLKKSTILVTGGTGSFGKTIAVELLKYNPSEIRILSRSEDKQEEMRYQFRKSNVFKYILGDVRDLEQVERAISDTDYVFHAAAQKQVPASEYNVYEAVKTNILGAQNVIDASIRQNVKKIIGISTDKAVEPVNAMGMTKALQEKLFIQANLQKKSSQSIFSCVRYGNVIGSTGSVLPLFLKQIRLGEPLTITSPEMTRFILTLEDAVDLVFTALVHSTGGEIFIPEIPTHKIVDLADALIELHPNQNIKKINSGIRVGEKLHETLITPTESQRVVKGKKHFIILPQIIIPKTEKKYKVRKKNTLFRYSSDTATFLSKDELKKFLLAANVIK